jgi:hypothetical protein
MSGVEVIRVLASVAQLIHYIVLILDSVSEFMGGLQKTHQYIRQLEQLLETARIIERSPSLQKRAVHSHIESALSQAQALSKILDRAAAERGRGSLGRLWRTVRATIREKEIVPFFDRLEKEKTALILCIVATNSDVLYEIQGGIELIHGAIPRMSQSSDNTTNRPPVEEDQVSALKRCSRVRYH